MTTIVDVNVSLGSLYAKWIDLQGLELASADEVLYSDKLTPYQRKWLTAFVDMWEATEAVEYQAVSK